MNKEEMLHTLICARSDIHQLRVVTSEDEKVVEIGKSLLSVIHQVREDMVAEKEAAVPTNIYKPLGFTVEFYQKYEEHSELERRQIDKVVCLMYKAHMFSEEQMKDFYKVQDYVLTPDEVQWNKDNADKVQDYVLTPDEVQWNKDNADTLKK